MRRLVTALLAFAISGPVVSIGPPVRLDEPGALDAIRQSNPEHYRKISAILETAKEYPCQSERFGRVIEAAFDARDGHCSLALKTSYPAQRNLAFTLGKTRYVAVVRMKDHPKLVPAK